MINHVRRQTAMLGFLSALILFPAFPSAAAPSRTIETVGIGRADPKLTNKTQRRATARDAAVQEAQAKMLAILNGLRQNAAAQNQAVAESGILRGAQVVKTEWIAEDQCRVTLRLDKKRYETLTGERLSGD